MSGRCSQEGQDHKNINALIRRIIEVEETIQEIIKIQLKWFGYLNRMNDTHNPKMVYEY